MLRGCASAGVQRCTMVNLETLRTCRLLAEIWYRISLPDACRRGIVDFAAFAAEQNPEQ